MSFQNLAGNEHLKKRLGQFITTRKILNSYVFAGESGIGKKTVSNMFVSAILCEAPSAGGACNNCAACKQFLSDNHPDVIYLQKSKDKKTLGIEEVREQIIKQVYIKPFIAQKKIFVINDGDSLTPEAQNGLLKVLEEPPEYVTFIILVSKKSLLLDTVLSRSCVFDLRPVTKLTVIDFLKNEYPSKTNDEHLFYAKFSQGVIGKAMKIAADAEFKAMFFDTSKFLSSTMQKKSALVDFHRYLLDNKENINTITDFMLIFLRDCIFSCEGLDDMIICPQNLDSISTSQADKKKFTSTMDSVIKYKNNLLSNANFTVLTLNLLIEIQANCNIN